MPLGMEVGHDPSDIVLHGDNPAPPPQKGAQPLIFRPCLLWPNGCMDQDATWYEGRPRPRPHCVRWGPSSPSLKREHSSPQILGPCFCGQTVGWIKMPLGTKVGLGAGRIVLYEEPAPPPPKGHSPPIFGPYLLRPNDCMDQDASWYGARPQPRGLCVRWGPSPPP